MDGLKHEKISKEEANQLYVEACAMGKADQMLIAVELLNADLDSYDRLGYARALYYLIDKWSTNDLKRLAMLKYLVNKGADVDFRHSDKYDTARCKTPFLYYVANNPNVPDEAIYFLIRKLENSYTEKSDLQRYLNSYNSGNKDTTIRDLIENNRPELYKKLLAEKKLEKNIR